MSKMNKHVIRKRPSANEVITNNKSSDDFSVDQIDKVNTLIKFGFKKEYGKSLIHPILIKQYKAAVIETASHLNPNSMIDVFLRPDGLMQWSFNDEFDSDELGLELIFDSICKFETSNLSN
jgi:hypothetical protein